MSRPKAPSVAAYLAGQPATQRRILRRIRADIRSVVRGSEDAISYGIPAAKREGKIVVWYAGFAKHVSMFPMGPGVLKAAKVDASKYVTSRGTIQFPLDKPPSSALVKRLVRARLAAMPAKGTSRR
jgi:uncharacterized protein YdhG (YjbR/CyaY superfamily)